MMLGASSRCTLDRTGPNATAAGLMEDRAAPAYSGTMRPVPSRA
jgi:hypothetical protein